MSIGIDPLIDFACKKLLGSPEHPAITLHFLNAILGGRPRITNVEILNPIIEKEFEDDKYAILDIRARDENGYRYNIEIQRTRPAGLRERLTFYAATQFAEQLGEGDPYTALRPSIGICILDVNLFPTIPELHLDFRLINQQHSVTLTDHFQIHLLELPKYTPPSDNSRITDPVEMWCYFFQNAGVLTAEEVAIRLDDPAFSEATGVLQMIARDPEQRSLYEARLKAERDARANLQYAVEEAKRKGEKIGEARGKVKVLQQLLHEESLSEHELNSLSLEELVALESTLQRRLRERA